MCSMYHCTENKFVRTRGYIKTFQTDIVYFNKCSSGVAISEWTKADITQNTRLAHVTAGFRTLSRELDWLVARSSVTASLSGLHCTTASHFPRTPFFFFRLKKQQHLQNKHLRFYFSLSSFFW